MTDDLADQLSHCAGYRLLDAGGNVGVVVDLRYRVDPNRPDHLVVRRGFFRRRRVWIPVDQVVEVDSERRRVVTHAPDRNGRAAG